MTKAGARLALAPVHPWKPDRPALRAVVQKENPPGAHRAGFCL